MTDDRRISRVVVRCAVCARRYPAELPSPVATLRREGGRWVGEPVDHRSALAMIRATFSERNQELAARPDRGTAGPLLPVPVDENAPAPLPRKPSAGVELPCRRRHPCRFKMKTAYAEADAALANGHDSIYLGG